MGKPADCTEDRQRTQGHARRAHSVAPFGSPRTGHPPTAFATQDPRGLHPTYLKPHGKPTSIPKSAEAQLKYQLELVPSGDTVIDRRHPMHVPLTTKQLSKNQKTSRKLKIAYALKEIEGMEATILELEAVRYPIAEAAAADAARRASTSSSGSQCLGNCRANLSES